MSIKVFLHHFGDHVAGAAHLDGVADTKVVFYVPGKVVAIAPSDVPLDLAALRRFGWLAMGPHLAAFVARHAATHADGLASLREASLARERSACAQIGEEICLDIGELLRAAQAQRPELHSLQGPRLRHSLGSPR